MVSKTFRNDKAVYATLRSMSNYIILLFTETSAAWYITLITDCVHGCHRARQRDVLCTSVLIRSLQRSIILVIPSDTRHPAEEWLIEWLSEMLISRVEMRIKDGRLTRGFVLAPFASMHLWLSANPTLVPPSVHTSALPTINARAKPIQLLT